MLSRSSESSAATCCFLSRLLQRVLWCVHKVLGAGHGARETAQPPTRRGVCRHFHPLSRMMRNAPRQPVSRPRPAVLPSQRPPFFVRARLGPQPGNHARAALIPQAHGTAPVWIAPVLVAGLINAERVSLPFCFLLDFFPLAAMMRQAHGMSPQP
jgi:hypothetical protein